MKLGWTMCGTGEGDGTPLQYSCLENSMDGGAWWATVHGITESRTRLSDFTFTFHFHASEKEMATHSSVLAWRITGTGEPDGLPSMGSHRVGHDWSDLAAAAACVANGIVKSSYLRTIYSLSQAQVCKMKGWDFFLSLQSLSILSVMCKTPFNVVVVFFNNKTVFFPY